MWESRSPDLTPIRHNARISAADGIFRRHNGQPPLVRRFKESGIEEHWQEGEEDDCVHAGEATQPW